MGHHGKSKKQHRHSKSANDEPKEKRKRKDSSSSSSTSSQEDNVNKRLDEIRKEKRRQRKLQKQLIKEKETPEEKRARRLAKKMRKEEKRRLKEESSLSEEVKYTNTNNPFNDPNLTSTFVWGKKLEYEGRGNLSMKEIERMSRERVRRNLAEMEELKRNREAREAAKEDLEMIKRDEERRANSSWEQTEESFHLSQARLRSRIRLKEGRGKPIDFLARYIEYDDETRPREKIEEEFELEDPLNYLKGLTVRDFEDLLEDIKVYRRLDPDKNVIWWIDLKTIANDELRKLNDDIRLSNARDSIHGSVRDDVAKIFKGKTLQELIQLEAQVNKKIHDGEEGTDVAYWESLLAHLHVHMAKGRIKERHKQILQYKLKKIREEQMLEADKHENEKGIESSSKSDNITGSGTKPLSDVSITLNELEAADEEIQEQKWRLLTEDEMEAITLEMYERGHYSPAYSDEKQAMPGIEILDAAEDLKKRDAMIRDADRSTEGSSTSASLTAKEREMEAVARKGMDKDEASFAVEAPLEAQTFLWSEKYRPRKPRYFNRVHTGFEWNKYNQTHYDMDNPPPKIVQGYRFNIFYPDLLDVTQTPTFTVTPCDDPDFAVLRFHAGPPYEDIAFKCVNREWEISHKHGYKCQFANGIFQLWFFFKRYRYRR
uniref:Splicing factor Cactin n=1 Tax=Ascaris suum TaxID=6253 RepID=F1KZD5_ASCSU